MASNSNNNRSASAALAAAALGLALTGAAAVRADRSEPDGPPSAPPSPARLQQLVPGVTVGTPEQTPVDGVFRVRVGDSYVYLSGDGRHAFTGDLLDLATGQNLTETRRNGDRLAALSEFPDDHLLILPAKGEEKARIRVFTDSSCPYCQKLHREVPALREAGVTVAYIPFPRGGPRGPGYRELRSVWCADDPAAAFDIAAGTADGELPDAGADCTDAKSVDAGYELGNAVGVRGTPTIVLPSGAALPGYVDAPRLLQRLQLEGAAAEGAAVAPAPAPTNPEVKP
jgi:thiol:disulfide interchange protein DsbC